MLRMAIASSTLFFLEVDRSTEPRETLARRVYGYQDFYRRGGLALRHGFTREDYKDFPFYITKGTQYDPREPGRDDYRRFSTSTSCG
jgi:hypothetical protein